MRFLPNTKTLARQMMLKAWMTRIAINNSISNLRAQKRLVKNTLPLDNAGEPPDDDDQEMTSSVNNIDLDTIMSMIAELRF